MTDGIANLFVDVHPSKSNVSLILYGNCFWIASTISVYSLRHMVLRVLADGNTNSFRNALYDHSSSRLDIAFHGLCSKMKLNMRYRLQVSWWNSQVWMSFAASPERFVLQFCKYTWNLNGKFDFALRTYNQNISTSFPHQYCHSCFINRWTRQFNYSDTVNSFNIAICAFASKGLPIELVPCSDGWRRTWWQTIHTMSGLPVSSILQCTWNRHWGAYLQLFHVIGRLEPTFI